MQGAYDNFLERKKGLFVVSGAQPPSQTFPSQDYL